MEKPSSTRSGNKSEEHARFSERHNTLLYSLLSSPSNWSWLQEPEAVTWAFSVLGEEPIRKPLPASATPPWNCGTMPVIELRGYNAEKEKKKWPSPEHYKFQETHSIATTSSAQISPLDTLRTFSHICLRNEPIKGAFCLQSTGRPQLNFYWGPHV